MIEIVFWSAAGLVAFTYAVFPALLLVRGRAMHRPPASQEITPRVSLIIAAYNEAHSIGDKLDNVLALDYPRDLLEVIIASDGSNDGTDRVVQRYVGDLVKLHSLPRRGKASALNDAVAASSGEILVFSDANSLYAPDALRALVRPFADPEVGGVAGNQRYLGGKGAEGDGEGEVRYWQVDRELKRAEGMAGNTISATGAIYAIRRSLFMPVPDGVTDDFVTSTRVIAQGKRLVFAPGAIALEPVAGTSGLEFGRKVRIMTRGFRGVLMMRELLNPFRFGFYSFQLFWHKVLRRLMVFPLLVMLVLNPFLLDQGAVYRWSMAAQAGLYGCALAYLALRNTRFARLKPLEIPFFFCMVNAAALVATWNVVRGYRIDRWEPKRMAHGNAAGG
ncbi:MAG TPA: glycosyltransferase family 2 protein [Candidatus Limnocylindria bacterium]|nr:glycosyltransferase family 2 protein [Candidatus Limnocylindria bacterium]